MKGGAGEMCCASEGVEEGGEQWGKGWCCVVVRGVQNVAGDAGAEDWWVGGGGAALRGRGSTEATQFKYVSRVLWIMACVSSHHCRTC